MIFNEDDPSQEVFWRPVVDSEGDVISYADYLDKKEE